MNNSTCQKQAGRATSDGKDQPLLELEAEAQGES
jgi:hypothetical protein